METEVNLNNLIDYEILSLVGRKKLGGQRTKRKVWERVVRVAPTRLIQVRFIAVNGCDLSAARALVDGTTYRSSFSARWSCQRKNSLCQLVFMQSGIGSGCHDNTTSCGDAIPIQPRLLPPASRGLKTGIRGRRKANVLQETQGSDNNTRQL